MRLRQRVGRQVAVLGEIRAVIEISQRKWVCVVDPAGSTRSGPNLVWWNWIWMLACVEANSKAWMRGPLALAARAGREEFSSLTKCGFYEKFELQT